MKDIAYEIFEPRWRKEIIDAKVLNISFAGMRVISEDVQEPMIILNLWPHFYGMESQIQVPCLAQVMWVSPVWEKFHKVSFDIGLQFLTKSLYKTIVEH